MSYFEKRFWMKYFYWDVWIFSKFCTYQTPGVKFILCSTCRFTRYTYSSTFKSTKNSHLILWEKIKLNAYQANNIIYDSGVGGFDKLTFGVHSVHLKCHILRYFLNNSLNGKQTMSTSYLSRDSKYILDSVLKWNARNSLKYSRIIGGPKIAHHSNLSPNLDSTIADWSKTDKTLF